MFIVFPEQKVATHVAPASGAFSKIVAGIADYESDS